MGLKSLIQWLLDSRTTPEEAGHSAMPSTSETVLLTQSDVFPTWDTIHQGVAPDDGYINIVARANNSDNAEMRIASSNTIFSSGQTNNNMDMACSAPVAKGQSYLIKGIQVKEIKIVFVKTLGALGGGYNCFVRRALSCLRPSFNFSLKNSLLAEATGFPTNPIQLFKRRISHLQRQESGFLSSLLATGGSASKGLPRKFCLATGRFGRGAIQQRHLIKAFVFLSQKAGLWPTYYRQTPRAHMSSLFRVSAINSFQTGGALC